MPLVPAVVLVTLVPLVNVVDAPDFEALRWERRNGFTEDTSTKLKFLLGQEDCAREDFDEEHADAMDLSPILSGAAGLPLDRDREDRAAIVDELCLLRGALSSNIRGAKARQSGRGRAFLGFVAKHARRRCAWNFRRR